MLQRLLLLVLATLLAAIGVVLVVGHRSATTSSAPNTRSPFAGPEMPPGLKAANFRLTDSGGRAVSLSQFRGQVVLLTFIHSRCHDACPLMVEQMKGALDNLPGGGHLPALGVSVAPGEDTPASRRTFLAQHRMAGRLAFLSGTPSVLRRVWHSYAIDPGRQGIGHSAFLLLIDKRGLERVGFAADQLTPEALGHDIRVLQAERS